MKREMKICIINYVYRVIKVIVAFCIILLAFIIIHSLIFPELYFSSAAKKVKVETNEMRVGNRWWI